MFNASRRIDKYIVYPPYSQNGIEVTSEENAQVLMDMYPAPFGYIRVEQSWAAQGRTGCTVIWYKHTDPSVQYFPNMGLFY